MDTDQGSAAPKTPGDQRETVKRSVLERVKWFPGYELPQENSEIVGYYGLLESFSDSAYLCDLAPFFQSLAPTFGENDSQSLPRRAKMTTIAKGPQAEWERWCKQYREAFLSVLGPSGFRAAGNDKGAVWDDDNTSHVVH